MQPLLLNKGFGGWRLLAVFLMVWGAGFMVGALAAGGLWPMLTGRSVLTMQQDMLDPKYAGAIKTIQFVTTLFAFGLPPVAFAFIAYKNGWLALGFRRPLQWRLVMWSLLIILASGPLIDTLGALNKALPIPDSMRTFFDQMEKAYEEQVKAIANVNTVGQYLLSLFMIALLPALFEELLFRGGRQNFLSRWWRSPWAAIIVTSILFSAIHGSWYGFLPRLLLGILLGAVFHHTRNLWYPILMHLVNNGVVVTVMFIQTLRGKPVEVSSEPSLPWWSGVLSAAVLFLLFERLQREPRPEPPAEVLYDPRNPFDEKNTFA